VRIVQSALRVMVLLKENVWSVLMVTADSVMVIRPSAISVRVVILLTMKVYA